MPKTEINIREIIGLSSSINSVKDMVLNVKVSLNSTIAQIDSKILNRNNIGGRLSNTYNQLSTIQNRITTIKDVVERGASSYYNVDSTVTGWKKTLVEKINEINK